MFDIICDECDYILIIDRQTTMNEYLKDADYLVDEEGNLKEESIQQYIIYKCPNCNKVYKITYKEWERRFRIELAKYVMAIRKAKMFKEEINPDLIDPDNGIRFCGQCDGYDGEGNCLIDVIKQCTIRKK